MAARTVWFAFVVLVAAFAVDLIGPGLVPRPAGGVSTAVCGGRSKPGIGLGTWLAPAKQMEQVVFDALRVGYRHIDCAPRYRNEVGVGAAFELAMSSKFSGGLGLSRSDIWVTSKLWINDTNPSDVEAAVSRSLRDLRLSYLDEFVIHWPVRVAGELGDDFTTEDIVAWDMSWFLDLWSAMEAEFRSGRVRTIGVSNLSPLKLTALQYVLGGDCDESTDGSVVCVGGVEGSCLTGNGRVLPGTLQVERHPSLAQTTLVQSAARAGIAVTAYSPLGNPGRPSFMRKAGDVDLLGHAVVQSIADDLGATPAQVLLAWGLATGTSVIPKTTKIHRLKENLGANSVADQFQQSHIDQLAQLDQHARLIDGHFFLVPGQTVQGFWDEDWDSGSDSFVGARSFKPTAADRNMRARSLV